MKKRIITLLLIVSSLIFLLSSCTDAEMSKMGGYGDEFKVELLNCDGTVARQWISSGKVASEKNSDGYYFSDKKTNALIEVTGVLIITKL